MRENSGGKHVSGIRRTESAGYVRVGAGVALAMLAAVALVIGVRRWAGALASPLGPTALFATGGLIVMLAVAIRVAWLLTPGARPAPWRDRVVMGLTFLAVFTLGASLAVPGTGIARVFFFALVAIEEGCTWAWYLGRVTDGQPAVAGPVGTICRPVGQDQSSEPTRSQPVAQNDVPPNEVVQQLTRSRAADGVESLTGWLRIPFAAGQRTGSVHVAFCPPFAATPELSVEQIGGPPSRVKTAQLLPYGVRLDLKLAAAAEETISVLLQFEARSA